MAASSLQQAVGELRAAGVVACPTLAEGGRGDRCRHRAGRRSPASRQGRRRRSPRARSRPRWPPRTPSLHPAARWAPGPCPRTRRPAVGDEVGPPVGGGVEDVGVDAQRVDAEARGPVERAEVKQAGGRGRRGWSVLRHRRRGQERCQETRSQQPCCGAPADAHVAPRRQPHES